jgi:LTXXQ motif family protein
MNTHGRHCLLFILIGIVVLIILVVDFSTHSLYAQNSLHSGHVTNTNNTISKYTGQENRIIKSLSPEDIESLQTGTGDAFGGMAKLAELNGYPGPRHVLDLANELELSNRQKENITTIYDNMKNKSVELGQEILNVEKIANEEFINKTITDSQMKQLIFKSSEIYGQLRYAHLSTHLKMLAILTPEQVNLYNNLRGYSP